jgi:PTS system mannose-specific IIA component
MIWRAVKEGDQGEGVLIMTDFSGGISYNMAFSFLKTDKVEVITGVNLPMILTFWNKRESRKMIELARDLQLSGTRSIAVARDLMEEKAAIPAAFMDVSKNV